MKKKSKKQAASWFVVILIAIGRDIALAAVISAFFCLMKWIGSLLLWSKSPSWGDFLGGGIGVFVLLFLLDVFSIIRYIVRCKRDPLFKEMSERTGIQWRDYKKLKGL